jgi:uncharacterized coiled-coil protein SlyX
VNSNDVEARFERLEVRLAHLEDTVLQLSNELATQQQLLERQVDRYRRLVDHINTASEGASTSTIEVPPHY